MSGSVAAVPGEGDAALEGLRQGLRALYLRHGRGEVHAREFERLVAERTVELYRARVQQHLGEAEPIRAEHHVLSGHFKLSQSVLRETEQRAVSLFVTDRRLVRLSALVVRDRPPTGDEKDRTVIDELPLRDVAALVVRRQIRGGEALAGLSIVAIALLFAPWLLFTGKLLLVIGGLGVIHALLLPTRSVEVQPRGPAPAEPFRVWSARRKSGRVLLQVLRARLREEGAHGD